MTVEPPHTILFLCTGNSARSILAEALMTRIGRGTFRALSAGSHPKGQVHPGALRWLAANGFETGGFRSKSWDEFAGATAPHIDFVVTVCDNAAGEACPIWPGKPIRAHWGIADPAAVEGSDEAVDAAFAEAARLLEKRIRAFADLPLDDLTPDRIRERMRAIGKDNQKANPA